MCRGYDRQYSHHRCACYHFLAAVYMAFVAAQGFCTAGWQIKALGHCRRQTKLPWMLTRKTPHLSQLGAYPAGYMELAILHRVNKAFVTITFPSNLSRRDLDYSSPDSSVPRFSFVLTSSIFALPLRAYTHMLSLSCPPYLLEYLSPQFQPSILHL